MGYEKYDDFAFSELIDMDINVNDINQIQEKSLFQENIAKIQTGGISLLKINDKTILSFFYAKETTKSIDIYMKKSIDNGLTWSSPRIISNVKNAYQHCANNRAILLTSGRIILPMAIGGTGSPNYIFCYYSDDFGNTWKTTKMFKTINNALYEPCIEELKNGKLIMTIRNSSGKIIFGFSTDKGLTWSNFVKTNLNSPDAPSTIARIPGKDWLLLIWNNNERIFDYHFRSPLSVAVSKDEGKTWKYLFDIENRANIGAYYPTINFTDNKVLITYTQKNVGDMKSSVVFSEILLSSLEELIAKKFN
jgi:Neuraminidase (sialidase)